MRRDIHRPCMQRYQSHRQGGAYMRRVFAFLAVLLLFCVGARAEGDIDAVVGALDLGSFEEAAAGTGIDVRTMLLSIASGEDAWRLEDVLPALRDAFLDEFRRAVTLVAALLAPALLSAIARMLAGEGKGGGAVAQLSCLVCAAQLVLWFVRLAAEAEALIAGVARLADGVFPVLASLLSLSGATASAAMVTPLSALAGNAFSRLLAGVGLKLCTVAAALAAAGHLSPRLRLERLFSLVRSVANWLSGVLMTGFLGLSAVRALLGTGYDSAAVRTARYAVDNLLPVVGGEVANTMDALVSSVLLVKNAAGVTGLIALLLLCARPLLCLVAALFALRLISALLEPVAEEGLTALADKFSQVAGMLLVLCVSAAVILTLLLGGTLTAGQGVVR